MLSASLISYVTSYCINGLHAFIFVSVKLLALIAERRETFLH